MEQGNSQSSISNIEKILKRICVVAVFILLVVVGFYFAKFNVRLSSENGDWGTFGDFVGGTLNPIFSLMSLFALLYTIVLQTKEMEQTREELKRSAAAQEKAEEALKGQLEAQRKQLFEGTFFALLDQHNKALERLMSPNDIRTNKHSDLEFIRDTIFSSGCQELSEAKSLINANNNLCGHYFRVLYQVLKFVSLNCPHGSDIYNGQKMYSGIVRSFIGNDVLQLLIINCYCTDHNDQYWKYKLLIEKYAFLEHFSPIVNGNEIFLFSNVTSYYDRGAFGENSIV